MFPVILVAEQSLMSKLFLAEQNYSWEREEVEEIDHGETDFPPHDDLLD
jgi:hypothetical protein